MSERNITTFLRGIEVPDIVNEKTEEVLAQIRMGGEKKIVRPQKGLHHLSKAAAIIIACILVSGTTVAAIELGSLYKQRMENMDEETLEGYYVTADAGETTEFNRSLTEEEKARRKQLEEDYEKNGLFPLAQIPCLKEGEIYQGEGIALDETKRIIYLPERELEDEELLEIIDFEHKLTYSIYAQRVEKIKQGDDWNSRMEQMTGEMVDRIYLIMFSNHLDISGGYSRPLGEEEEKRYEELTRAYEEDGKYVEEELSVIQTPEEYTGAGIAICVSDSIFYFPENELTDEELLQLIDFEHKVPYCLDRIHEEIQMGLRDRYPGESEPYSKITLTPEERRLEQQQIDKELQQIEQKQNVGGCP